MIVQRMIVKVKTGSQDSVVELLKAARAGLDDPSSMRILTSEIGVPRHTVVYELTVESVEENRRRWTEWENRAETPAFMEKWFQVVEDWNDEYYNVV